MSQVVTMSLLLTSTTPLVLWSWVYDDGGTASLADDTIAIHGQAYGGLDTGSTYGNPAYTGVWQIGFTYNNNFVSGGNNIEVGPGAVANTGSIQPLFPANGGASIPLEDYAGKHDYTFRFNNIDNHRLDGSGLSGPETFVGWGWLNHSGEEHVAASDWLFTGTAQVPEPATMTLLGASLLFGACAHRRRKEEC